MEEIINILNNEQSLSSLHSTPREVWDIIKKLLPGKAPGHYNIPNIALKYLPKTAIMRLTHIYTVCLRLSYFPVQWKKTMIVMTPKLFKITKIPKTINQSHNYLPYPMFLKKYY